MTPQEELQLAKTEIELLNQKLTQALERIVQLEAQLAQNSRNSSKSPSSDGFNRPPKNKTRSLLHKATGKKPGGQLDHQGHNLVWNDQPQSTLRHSPRHCQSCYCVLDEVPGRLGQARQVVDLPQELKLQTVEQQLYTKQCPKCQTFNTASFPLEVANWVQYGPKIRALAVYLNQVQLLPYARSCEILRLALLTGDGTIGWEKLGLVHVHSYLLQNGHKSRPKLLKMFW